MNLSLWLIATRILSYHPVPNFCLSIVASKLGLPTVAWRGRETQQIPLRQVCPSSNLRCPRKLFGALLQIFQIKLHALWSFRTVFCQGFLGAGTTTTTYGMFTGLWVRFPQDCACATGTLPDLHMVCILESSDAFENNWCD